MITRFFDTHLHTKLPEILPIEIVIVESISVAFEADKAIQVVPLAVYSYNGNISYPLTTVKLNVFVSPSVTMPLSARSNGRRFVYR